MGLDEVFVKINGERHYLWRTVDHEDEALESYIKKKKRYESSAKVHEKSDAPVWIAKCDR